MDKITRDELKTKLDGEKRIHLVEALPESAWREGHLPGAVNIPSGQAARLALSLLPDKAAEVIVYCSKFT